MPHSDADLREFEYEVQRMRLQDERGRVLGIAEEHPKEVLRQVRFLFEVLDLRQMRECELTYLFKCLLQDLSILLVLVEHCGYHLYG